jgi:subfamily B ATP-binding cassette protein MsbA
MGLGLSFPLVIARLLDSVTRPNSVGSLNRLALLLTGIFLAQAIFSFFQSYLLALVGEHIVYDLRTNLYGQFQSMSLDFFGSNRIGELVSRLTNDVTQMRNMLTTNLAFSLSQSASLIGAVVIVLTVSPRLTLFMFAIIPAIVLIASIFGRLLQNMSKGVQSELARSTVIAEETLQGIRVVKSFGREQYEKQRFGTATQKVLHASLRQAVCSSSFNALMMFLSFASLGAVMWYGGHEVISGRLSLAMITGFLMYAIMIAGSLGSLAGLYGQLRIAMGGIQRVFQILDLRPSVLDIPQATDMPAVRGNVTFDNVSFAYEEGRPVLDGITLNIRSGEILALVGPSGAGKSTLFNLIPRFYDPTSGSVQIDGFDLRTVTQNSLRDQIAIVPQETVLFGGTIRENILYGRLNANESEMLSAAKAANAHEFIMRLPGQYDEVVGERGTKLSGGQRQRVAVARAILKDPHILLLDEATSSLDSESEEIVQDALNRLMLGRTTVIIAHRLSTIKAAHRIAVLDRGRITELGSHEELMKLNGLYTRLYMMQFRDSAEDRSESRVSELEQQPCEEISAEGASVSFTKIGWATKLLQPSASTTQ